MNAGVDAWLVGMPWPRLLGFVIDVSIKAAIVVAGAWLATLLLRRSSAYARSTVWIFALVVLLALPLTQIVTPLWNLPLIPEVGAWFKAGDPRSALVVPVEGTKDMSDASDAAAGGGLVPATLARAAAPGWPAWIICAWAAGAVLGFLWLAMRAAAGRRMLRRCEGADEAWRDILDEICAKLDLCARVRVFESREIDAAVTIGAINPAIVVPAGSSSWPHAQRLYILAHELAHIKRRDGLVEVIALVASGVYWFNPFVWGAVRSLRIERERDCDDAVLGAGAKPSDYATFLLNLAAAMSAERRAAWQLSTISQGSNLKERIMCILDPKIDRDRAHRRAGIVSCLLLASVILPLSISGIWETQAQEQEKCDKAKKEEALKKDQHEKMTKAEWDNLSDEEKAAYKEKEALKAKMAGMSSEEKIAMQWKKIESQEGSAAVQVHHAIVKKGPEAGMKLAQKMRESGDDTYYFKEGEFNVLGYVFLYDKKIDEAITVFKMNVEMHPDSWNTYDSLGEALLAAGKCEKARKMYEKSLALNPDSENGKKMLAQVEKCEKEGSYAKAK